MREGGADAWAHWSVFFDKPRSGEKKRERPVCPRFSHPAGQQTAVNFVNGSDTLSYDTAMRMHTFAYSIGGGIYSGTANWNQNGTLGGLNISDSFNPGNTQNCSYGYDDLARIASVNCVNGSTTVWTQTFNYDAFGNISKSGSSSFAALYANSPQNNQITNMGFTYDTNGNVTYDGINAYTWDPNWQKISSIAGPHPQLPMSLTYDAVGNLVEVNSNVILYSPIGKLGMLGGSSFGPSSDILIPTPVGKFEYKQDRTGALAPVVVNHPDWLGSKRFASTPTTNSFYGSVSFAPFGETYGGGASTPHLDFTGHDQDVAPPGTYDFPARKYSAIQSRWLSPDPAGSAAVNFLNPQSINRYAYVMNSPMDMIDPLGLNPGDLVMIMEARVYARDMAKTAAFFSRFEFFKLLTLNEEGEHDGWLGFVGPGNTAAALGNAASNLEQKQLNALKGCVKKLYNIDLRTFTPVAPNSNGYFYGLTASGGGVTIETNVTHSSWNLALTVFPPSLSPAGRTPLSTNSSQTNYVASDQLVATPGLIQPTQVHEDAHSLDQITSASVFGSSEASADRLLTCVNENQ